MGTTEQEEKIKSLILLGYTWDKAHSVSAAGVVMRRLTDFYFFGLDGSITHNPDALLHIKIAK